MCRLRRGHLCSASSCVPASLQARSGACRSLSPSPVLHLLVLRPSSFPPPGSHPSSTSLLSPAVTFGGVCCNRIVSPAQLVGVSVCVHRLLTSVSLAAPLCPAVCHQVSLNIPRTPVKVFPSFCPACRPCSIPGPVSGFPAGFLPEKAWLVRPLGSWGLPLFPEGPQSVLEQCWVPLHPTSLSFWFPGLGTVVPCWLPPCLMKVWVSLTSSMPDVLYCKYLLLSLFIDTLHQVVRFLIAGMLFCSVLRSQDLAHRTAWHVVGAE